MAKNRDYRGISTQYGAPVVLLKKWVDFEYEVDGQIYQFSMSGGEKITLSQLVEALGIIGNTVNGEEAAFYSAEEFLGWALSAAACRANIPTPPQDH